MHRALRSGYGSWLILIGAVLLPCRRSAAGPGPLEVTPVPDRPWQHVEKAVRPALQAPRAAAPVIDGLLDDATWAGVPAVDTFTRLQGVPRQAAHWVTIRASHDDENLYLAGRLAIPGQKLRATVTEHGGTIWQDDALEIFLHDRQRGVRYQIDINALGTWWAGAYDRQNRWTPTLSAAARIDEQGWTVELALPWRDLGMPAPGDRPLGVQFRYLVSGQSGSSSWTDHTPEQTAGYGDLALTEAGEPVGLEVLRYFQYDELPRGRSAAAAGVEVRNATGAEQSVNVRLSHVDLVASPRLTAAPTATLDAQQTVIIPAGQSRAIRLDGVMPARDADAIRQTLQVRHVNDAGQPTSQRLFQHTRDVAALPALRLRLKRERFYHGDKVVQGMLAIGVPENALASASLHVEFGTRRHILAEARFDQLPARHFAVALNLDGLEPATYQLIATLRTGEQVIEQAMPVVIERAVPLPTRQRIAVRVNLPHGVSTSDAPVPLYVGVSFPGGTLLDLNHVRLVREDGTVVPSQIEALAHWGPQGSIRWAGIHFQADADANYFVEFGSEIERAPHRGSAVTIERTGAALRVNTGAATFEVPHTGPLLGRAWLGDRLALRGDAACLIVADQHGQIATELGGPAEESPQVETAGPLHVVIRREGLLRRDDGSTLGKYIVRLFFDAGQSSVRMQHSFVNTEDTEAVQYSDLAVRVKPAEPGPWTVQFDRSPAPGPDAAELHLDPSQGEAVSMAQLVYRHHGQSEQRAVIGVRRAGNWQEVEALDACGQWASIVGASEAAHHAVGVAVTVRDFVETFPSELEAGPQGLTAHLWSSRGGRLLDYRAQSLVDYFGREWFDKGSRASSTEWGSGAAGMAALPSSAAGTARTHDLAIHLFPSDAEDATTQVAQVAQLLQQPPLALQDPAWLRKTEAVGPLSPHDPHRFPRAERFIESFFRYFLVEQADFWGNYGFLDHGSGPHGYHTGSQDYREHHYPLLKRAYHFGYKFRSTPWRMYARSGDRMYFKYGDTKNRHLADFRWVHHPARGLRHGAMIVSQVSITLPLYWAASESLGFQGQDIDNFIYQYYLTGDRWVYETVQDFAGYMARHFDPRTTRPAGDMYNYQPYMFLASLYEMTWDERLGDKLRAMRWTLDEQTSTGLRDWPSMGAWYKWYAELFGPLRDYMVTGSHEARETFLKLARLYITHAPAGRHLDGDMGYDDNYGLAMNVAWQLTGDHRFAAHAREMLARRLFWFSHDSGQTHRVGPYVWPYSAQGLDSMAYLMDLVAHMPADLPRYPAVELGDEPQQVDVYVIKPAGKAARLEMLCGGAFDVHLTHLLDAADARKRLGTFELTTRPRYAARSPQAGLHQQPHHAELTLPKEMLPGEYRLRDVREVAWSDAAKLVVVAPDGLSIPAATANPVDWYFLLPAGKRGAIHADQPILLEYHGKQQTLGADAWHELQGGPEDALVRVAPARTAFEPLPFQKGRGHTVIERFVKASVRLQFRGEIPPVLAPHDPGRFFVPHDQAAVSPDAEALRSDALRRPMADAPD